MPCALRLGASVVQHYAMVRGIEERPLPSARHLLVSRPPRCPARGTARGPVASHLEEVDLFGRVERRVTPAPPHGTRRADFPHRALQASPPRTNWASRRSDWDMGVGLCVPAMRRDADALVCRPLPSTGLSPASPVLWADPTSPRRSWPLRLPLGFASAAPARGSGGISRVPCAPRPCVPTAEAPVDACSPWPYRASAGAFPAVAYGSASTVSGISGLVPFSPAAGGFRPTGFLSTLRPGRHRTGRKTRSQPRGGSPRSRWDSPCRYPSTDHPLGSADLARRTQRPALH